MVRLICRKCDEVLELGDECAGHSIRCTKCGEINEAPAAPAKERTPEQQARVEAEGLPPERGPEQRVMRIRKTMFRSRPLTCSLTWLVAVGGLVAAIYFGAIQANPVGGWISFILAVLGWLVLGWWKLMTYSASLTITNKRTIARRGILSRATSEVLHDNIRNVQIQQNLWERIWRIGTISISSAGQAGVEIEMRRVPSPDRVREIIDLYRPF